MTTTKSVINGTYLERRERLERIMDDSGPAASGISSRHYLILAAIGLIVVAVLGFGFFFAVQN
jgi:hypothetical protein